MKGTLGAGKLPRLKSPRTQGSTPGNGAPRGLRDRVNWLQSRWLQVWGRLGIRGKLFAGFGAAAFMLLVVGLIGWNNTSNFSSDFDRLYTNSLVPMTRLGAVDQALAELRIGTAVYASADEYNRRKLQANEPTWVKQIDDNMAAYASANLGPRQQEGLKVWQEAYTAYGESAKKVNQLEADGNMTAANIYRTQDAGKVLARASESIQALATIEREAGEQDNAGVASTASTSKLLLLGAIAAGLAISVATAFFISRTIAGAVRAVGEGARTIARNDLPSFVSTARALAAGDLTKDVKVTATRVNVTSKDELGAMAADFNEMVDGLQETGAAFAEMRANLRDMVGQVQVSADSLAAASEQLGSATHSTGSTVSQVTAAVQGMAIGAQETSTAAQTGNMAVEQLANVIDDIARGAGEQAEQVRNASSTATQMTAEVERVAENANIVATTSRQAKVTAERGAEAVRATVTGMSEIETVVTQAAAKVEELGRLGEKIGAVVETIDEIADQTNLLALNAAIEAARAGEHGRGFAVVADEVRKLAERSRNETKAISALIGEVRNGTKQAVQAIATGSAKVRAGSQQADRTGAALAEILEAVETTVAQVNDIAAAAQGLTAGAKELTTSIQVISEVVEQNDASTKEMVSQATRVTTAIQSVAAVSEEQNASSEEVSASAEEMAAQVQEMGAQAQELAVTAEQLRRLVEKFILDDRIENVVEIRRAA